MSEPVEYCFHCGAKMKMYWDKLTPMLVNSLMKFRRAVKAKGINHINKNKDMKGTVNELTHNEHCNWSKLAHHGLVIRAIVPGQDWKRGDWKITRLGEQFLLNKVRISVRVKTFRNKVVEYDKELVNVFDVLGSSPYLEDLPDIEWENASNSIQEGLF